MTKMNDLNVLHEMSKPGNISVKEICAAIASPFRKVYDEFRVQTPEEITESIPQTPLMQVYPDGGGGDIGGNDDRGSFKAGIRRNDMTVFCDVYARQRSDIGTDLSVCLDILDECITVVESQNTKPYFGRPEIKGFSWRWEKFTLEYNKVLYVGFRLTLIIKVF